MPKRHTAQDEEFARHFSIQLKAAYELARSEGMTRTEFASSLGVGSTVLQDLLNGTSMPGVRSLALAVDKYDIDVTYEGTDFRAHKPSLVPSRQEQQLRFPFVLSALDPQVTLKMGPVTDHTITFGIQIRKQG